MARNALMGCAVAWKTKEDDWGFGGRDRNRQNRVGDGKGRVGGGGGWHDRRHRKAGARDRHWANRSSGTQGNVATEGCSQSCALSGQGRRNRVCVCVCVCVCAAQIIQIILKLQQLCPTTDRTMSCRVLVRACVCVCVCVCVRAGRVCVCRGGGGLPYRRRGWGEALRCAGLHQTAV